MMTIYVCINYVIPCLLTLIKACVCFSFSLLFLGKFDILFFLSLIYCQFETKENKKRLTKCKFIVCIFIV